MIYDRLIRLGCCALLATAVSCTVEHDCPSSSPYGRIDVGGLTLGEAATTGRSAEGLYGKAYCPSAAFAVGTSATATVETSATATVGTSATAAVLTRGDGADDETEADAETVYKAEDVAWFREVLEKGLTVEYSNQYSEGRIVSGGIVCTLQYHPAAGNYTLTREEDNLPAEWLGNGSHLFVGKYIPDGLYEESDAKKDQHEAAVYDMLSQYTSMKSSSLIDATVDRISLPFQHRLSRVIVQIIIDPSVRKDYTDADAPQATIKGYDSSNGGGADCTLRFCKVQLLDKVNSDKQPVWTTKGEDNKVVPHFIGEKDGVYYQKDSLDAGAYYDKVPCFDLIVRPTYLGQIVMEDEADDISDEDENGIYFNITLDNGMVYEKQVDFDLNPGEQTTITLYINREGINYNDAGTSNWIKDNFRQDDYYGINNELDHNLSKAGSCWQRAYRIGVPDYDVTDGSNPEQTQYVTEDVFIQYLSEAYEGGAHHGDYFVLTGDLSLPADWTAPVFTGHLDGRHHKITLPTGSNALFSGLNGTYDAPVGTANIHGPNSPMMGYRAEILNLYLANTDATFVSGECSGYIWNCHIAGSTVEP